MYALIIHYCPTLFFKTFADIQSKINVTFYHTFVFDEQYFDTKKQPLSATCFQLKTSRFDMYQFTEVPENPSFLFSHETNLLQMISEDEFQEIIQDYSKQMANNNFQSFRTNKKNNFSQMETIHFHSNHSCFYVEHHSENSSNQRVFTFYRRV